MIRFFARVRRPGALFFITLFLIELLTPSFSWALTSGPTQPEVQSFQPAGTSDMVDVFSGDFSYNIPLFELPGPNGGYPFNLSYQAGVSMDQEASWVGLGWTLQPGAINRQMRGLPDEFKGDEVKTKMSINPNVTVGFGAGGTVELFGSDAISLGVGLSVYYNNYKGPGYSIDATLSFSKAVASGRNGLSLGVTLDSKEGASVSPSLSLQTEIGEVGLGTSYNTKRGLSTLSVTHSVDVNKGRGIWWASPLAASSSASFSFAHPSYTPQISMPMKNINLSATFKPGGAWWAVFAAPYVTGFYNEQWLDDDKRWKTAKAYGYMNYQSSDNGNDMFDFNREKDGMVNIDIPNLAVTSLTYDVYSVTGQGIGMMYRPMRTDHGIMRDQVTTSTSNAVGVGVDVGPAASHVGVNLSVNHGESSSGAWTDRNNLASRSEFQSKTVGSLYEPYYFKVHGEPTAESTDRLKAIGGEKAVRVQLTGQDNDFIVTADPKLQSRTGSMNAPNDADLPNSARQGRAQTVFPITNQELLSDGVEMLDHFKITYLNSSGIPTALNRSTLPVHHYAGYTALTGEGLRYNYGIPAYNILQEDVTFSAKKKSDDVRFVDVGTSGDEPKYDHTGTDKFLKRTEMPPYAHAYLLTSILGPDYVDLTNNGVTEDDLGYWVKFTYKKTNSDYGWRDPYVQAHYQEGYKTDPRDDKGTFVYGKKEIWYLAKAETKSHIAEFKLDAATRKDARGVLSKIQNNKTSQYGQSLHSLQEVKLYSRHAVKLNPTNPAVIKTVKFQYDYSLCPNVYNNDGVAQVVNGTNINLKKGKLTLKKVWFEYGGTARGSLNPYVFEYPQTLAEGNPDYDVLTYDRWGMYKPYSGTDKYSNNYFPYSEQDPTKKAEVDRYAGSWSIKKITLPSGGQIIVDYESDDYAYVQNKTAMQMVKMEDPYGSASAPGNTFNLLHGNRKVRFKLEKPIPVSQAPNQVAEVMKYVDTKTWQLYFKMLIDLKKPGSGFWEYLTGYVTIVPNAAATPMGLESVGTDYVYGYFYVKDEGGGKNPFTMRAWQHLRTNQPELTNIGEASQSNNTDKRIAQIKSLGNIFASVKQLFKGFNGFCESQGYGAQVDATKSWIRLNSPDKIKFGGGLRVKQITMKDNWSDDEEGIYGQVYDYTTVENGNTISSGVAAYEPFIGGDENALRYAKKFTQSIPLSSDNNLYFEYPANESNYPGAQVGYSKVTVMSLASAALAGKTLTNNGTVSQPILPAPSASVSYGTSGSVVHEFYTAKDFPVITDETEKEDKDFNFSAPIPFVGNVAIHKLATTQGYSIVTNNMHGKPKKVSNYRQDKAGKFEPEPISWVKYNYLSETKVIDKEKVLSLINTLKENTDQTLSVIQTGENPSNTFFLGQENEFFYDMRQYDDNTFGGGVRVNLDVLYIYVIFGVIPIPVTTAWPSIGISTTRLQVATTNKIIFKSGILESTEAFDGGSLVKTKNIKWDKLTGSVVLSTVNNNYDELVYNYTVPAFRQYQGMGAAYQNIGLTLDMSGIQKDPYVNTTYKFLSASTSKLHPGDEILLYPAGTLASPKYRVIYTGSEGGKNLLYCEQNISETALRGMVVRSGYRNQLTVAAGSITALDNPSVTTIPVVYQKTISTPKTN